MIEKYGVEDESLAPSDAQMDKLKELKYSGPAPANRKQADEILFGLLEKIAREEDEE